MSRGVERCRREGHHRWSGVRSALQRDMARFREHDAADAGEPGLRRTLSILLQPSTVCLALHRVSHLLWVRGWRRSARFLSRTNHYLHKADLSHESCIGPGCFLAHTVGTCFVGSAGRDLTLYFLAVVGPREDAYGDASAGPWLGDGVTVGAQSTVIGHVALGDRVSLAPRTRVAADCPADSLVVSAIMRSKARPRTAPPAARAQSSSAL